jgi:bifunctional non-homologous end joining protein LigD
MASLAQTVNVDGRRLRITNLDKVLYPESDTTKADVLAYYAEVAPFLVPHTANRAATRKRWPNGVGTADQPGQPFFEKALSEGVPDWILRRGLEHSGGTKQYPLVNDRPTLVWLAQMAALEIHVPQWQFGRTGVQRNPDRLVLDLDPGPGAGLPECAEVARLTRSILEGMGLSAFPVTSGSKGIHLYAPLDGSITSDQASALARELARAIEADNRELVVSEMAKSLRDGRVFIDWSQNNGKKTTIAPYSLRGRVRPTAAAPRTWEELEDPDICQLEYLEVLERVREFGDVLAPLTESRTAGLEPTPARMATFETTELAADRLAKYRSMRNAAKTPEPVPDGGSLPGSGNSFVIQEHHARGHHFDFRLEHDGVLVSWALPHGVPPDGKTNHLAVQTEDHPLEYGTFEGTIPKGQYGAGTVQIWDAGTFELEKWRDDKEVIAVLHGEPGGGLGGVPRRYALIHTGRDNPAGWMIHLMDGSAKTRHRHFVDEP